nr:hypothetical protein [Ferrovum sp.]
MRDSLARICQSLENDPAWERAQEAASTGKSCALLATFDPATSSLKMSQQSFLADSNASWPTWPRSGMISDGRVYALPTVVPTITGTDGGVWLSTPTASASQRSEKFQGGNRLPNPAEFVMMWPTPGATDGKGAPSLEQVQKRAKESKRGVMLPEELARDGITGQLNPDWVEWLMGFPIGYTASRDSGTHKCRSKRRLRGKS